MFCNEFNDWIEETVVLFSSAIWDKVSPDLTVTVSAFAAAAPATVKPAAHAIDKATLLNFINKFHSCVLYQTYYVCSKHYSYSGEDPHARLPHELTWNIIWEQCNNQVPG